MPIVPADVTTKAMPVKVMVGNDARRWAVITADLIVRPDPKATIEAREALLKLRQSIAGSLTESFSALSSASVVPDMANQATDRIIKLASTTRWSMNFSHSSIRESIRELIHRNLTSAAIAGGL